MNQMKTWGDEPITGEIVKRQDLDPSKAGEPIRKKLSKGEKQARWWKRNRERLFRRNLKRLEAAASGDRYDDEDAVAWASGEKEITPEEIAEHGSIDAAMRFKRTALDARRPRKAAPVYLEYAKNLVEVIAKEKSAEKAVGAAQEQRPVNVYIGNMNVKQALPADYGEQIVDDED